MTVPRMERLAQELQQEIAVIIHRELKHPGLGFVTITRMELSKDLRHAKVGFSCLGDADERASSQQALDRSAPFIQSLLKKRFRLKVIPALEFRYDTSIEESIALSEKFERLKPPPEAP
jgi:ribosome-binding factor A